MIVLKKKANTFILIVNERNMANIIGKGVFMNTSNWQLYPPITRDNVVISENIRAVKNQCIQKERWDKPTTTSPCLSFSSFSFTTSVSNIEKRMRGVKQK